MLSSQRIAKTDILSNLNKEKTNNPNTNPLIQDGQILIPSVTRVFSKSREMYVYLQAYQPKATAAVTSGGVCELLPRQQQSLRNASDAGDGSDGE